MRSKSILLIPLLAACQSSAFCFQSVEEGLELYCHAEERAPGEGWFRVSFYVDEQVCNTEVRQQLQQAYSSHGERGSRLESLAGWIDNNYPAACPQRQRLRAAIANERAIENATDQQVDQPDDQQTGVSSRE